MRPYLGGTADKGADVGGAVAGAAQEGARVCGVIPDDTRGGGGEGTVIGVAGPEVSPGNMPRNWRAERSFGQRAAPRALLLARRPIPGTGHTGRPWYHCSSKSEL